MGQSWPVIAIVMSHQITALAALNALIRVRGRVAQLSSCQLEFLGPQVMCGMPLVSPCGQQRQQPVCRPHTVVRR